MDCNSKFSKLLYPVPSSFSHSLISTGSNRLPSVVWMLRSQNGLHSQINLLNDWTVAHFQTHLAKADGFAKSCDLKNRAIAQTKSVLECGTDVTTSGKAAVHLKQWQLFKRLVSMLYCNCIRTQNAFHERRAKSSRKGCFVWSRVALARVEINQWDRVVTVDLIGSS